MTESTEVQQESKPLLLLRRHLTVWSDEIEVVAVALAERHRHLLGGRLGNAQLNGLSSIAHSTDDFSQVHRFVKHQGEKAERAGLFDIQGYWTDLHKSLAKIEEEEAPALAAAAGVELPSKEGRGKKRIHAALNPLCLAMTREFVQHFVSHSLMIASTE